MPSPIVTILTQNQKASKRVQQLLQSLFQMKPIEFPSSSTSAQISLSNHNSEHGHRDDALDNIFHSNLKLKFNSNISICNSSETIFHFLSLDHGNDNDDVCDDGKNVMSLLAMTKGLTTTSSSSLSSNALVLNSMDHDVDVNDTKNAQEAIIETRQLIASHILINHQIQNDKATTTATATTSTSSDDNEATRILTTPRIMLMNIRFLLYKYFNLKSITLHDLIGSSLPILDLPTTQDSPSALSSNVLEKEGKKKDKAEAQQEQQEQHLNTKESSLFSLREIVIPYMDEITNPKINNGLSFLQSLSSNTLFKRPKTGLYQWPLSSSSSSSSSSTKEEKENGVVIRPIPCSISDHTLPPITFIFKCHSLSQAQEYFLREQQKQLLQTDNAMKNEVKSNGMHNILEHLHLKKVGYTVSNPGQLQIDITHSSSSSTNTTSSSLASFLPSSSSFEFRYCQSKELSSIFCEAQDSLLAGSLDDLQNTNVISDGDHNIDMSRSSSSSNEGKEEGTMEKSLSVDDMIGLGDCWVEFRANLRNPSGFVKKMNYRKQNKVAKPPDLPFE